MKYLLVLQLIMHMIRFDPKKEKRINAHCALGVSPNSLFGIAGSLEKIENPAITMNGSLLSERRGFGKAGCNRYLRSRCHST